MDEIEGLTVDASGTKPGAGQPDLTLNMEHDEFKAALGKIGFNSEVAKDGTQLLRRDNLTFSFFVRNSTGRFGAQFSDGITAGFKIKW